MVDTPRWSGASRTNAELVMLLTPRTPTVLPEQMVNYTEIHSSITGCNRPEEESAAAEDPPLEGAPRKEKNGRGCTAI